MHIKKQLILIFLLVIFLLRPVYADDIDINPTSLRYDNVMRGGYALYDVYIKTDSNSDVKVNFVASGDVADWISIGSKGSLFLNSNSPVVLSVVVRPPQGVSNGEHKGSISIFFSDTASSQISSSANNDFVLPVSVYVTDQIISDVKINNVLIDDAVLQDPLLLIFDVKNNGNIDALVSAKVDIKDVQGKTLKSLRLDSSSAIRPTQEQKVIFSLDSLDLGDYTANINLLLGDFLLKSVTTKFAVVLDKSQLRKISFTHLQSNDKGHVNHDFNLISYAKNNGEDVTVRFAGKLYYEGTFLSDITSDFVLAKFGEDTPVKFGFKPTKIGFYKISGHLETPTLDITQDRESAFEIVAQDVALNQVPLSSNPILAILLMLVAIFVFVKINKRKSKNKKPKKRKR